MSASRSFCQCCLTDDGAVSADAVVTDAAGLQSGSCFEKLSLLSLAFEEQTGKAPHGALLESPSQTVPLAAPDPQAEQLSTQLQSGNCCCR
mmetsp:Transcript_94111/g.172489  ORF Transcript_94111/g.172489 Transcript_94111/m.172489 type:complete len:91 (+) Transcript_94111:263-535(+)